MIRNYIVIAFRHFKRNQVTSIINLLGLSLGLATCLVAGLYIKHDLQADKFHEDLNSIFKVTVKMREFTMNNTPYIFNETAEKDIPEITSSLRTASSQTALRINNEIYNHEVVFADPHFLKFFTFPLENGNRDKALSGLRQVVISHDMKEKYFPGIQALGQRMAIQLENKFEDFEVSGVAAPTPAYSSIYFDFLIPLDNRYVNNPQAKDSWDWFNITSFLKIDPEKTAAFDKAMPAYMKKYLPLETNPDDSFRMMFVLNPFSEHHLSGGYGGGGLRDGKNGQSLIVFGGIAVIILLLACFNFMNLTNAQSSKRSIEVGIKKVVGAMRAQLVRQFLVEAIVLSVIAAMLALGLAELSLFVFRDLLQTSISIFHAGNLDVYGGFVLITLVSGLLAGSYPSFVLANIQTLSTFKRKFKIGGSNWITRSILSLQFGISIILIVCAIVMWRQQKYISEKDLGFNREQLLAIHILEKDTGAVDFLKNEIKSFGETVNVTKTSTNFSGQGNITHHVTKDQKSLFIYVVNVDEDFIPTMEMTLVKGEKFKAGKPVTSIVVNETLLKQLNLQDSVGIRLGGRVGSVEHPTIIGVVKDFHHAAVKHEIAPLMMINSEADFSYYLLVRLSSENTMTGLNKVRTLWEKTVADSPFDFAFVDDNVQKQYEEEVRWSLIITLATGMAIFLSILGLLGLAMFTAEQRKKEIGIRKVLGASVSQLINLLSKDYAWLICIAFVVSIPVSWYIMDKYWLSNFVYKVEIDVVVYVIALVTVLLITGVTIGSQTLRAALQNPADTLKEE
jgi:putative ABC transport system permease protein